MHKLGPLVVLVLMAGLALGQDGLPHDGRDRTTGDAAVVAAPDGPNGDALVATLGAATAALGNGDLSAALGLSAEAEILARNSSAPDPQTYAYALSNHGYVLALQDGVDRPRALFAEAMRYLEIRDNQRTEAWATAALNLAWLEDRAGRPDAAMNAADALMRGVRGTAWHGRAAAGAFDIHFRLGSFARASAYLQEALAADPAAFAATYGAIYVAASQARESAEARGSLSDGIALIDAQIAILDAFPFEGAAAGRKTLLSSKFALLMSSDEYGPAAEALRAWAAAGPLDPEDRALLDELASDFTLLTQLSGYSDGRATQLGRAELAVAIAELLGDPADLRLGAALRERALSEANLGRTAQAQVTLGQAAEVLARSPEGRRDLSLLLSDMAANAWASDELALARDLYLRADEAQASAAAEGAPAPDPLDLAIAALNRAELLTDLGDVPGSLSALQDAGRQFAAAAPEKWNGRVVGARIDAARARALFASGQVPQALAEMRRAVAAARAAYPPGHPAFALMLSNAGDLLAAAGHLDEAIPLVEEALAIYADAVPVDLPDAVATRTRLAMHHLVAGNQSAALADLRRVVAARKSPAYRDSLPEVAHEFEILAWLHLESAGSGHPSAVAEAFEALQWTQVTRSAQAVAMLEARVTHEQAGMAPLLRQRQDLIEAHRRATSAALQAYAGSTGGIGDLAGVQTRLARLETELRQTDLDIGSAGVDVEGLGVVNPISLSDVQAMLKPQELLVTFVLPGLDPDRVPGVGTTSNRVIAISRDQVRVAPVAEARRTALVARIEAFRCTIAVSDPGCSAPRSGQSRGAMRLALLEGAGTAQADELVLAQGLYRDLFGGIAAPLDEARHVIIVAPPELMRLPFHALVRSPDRPVRPGGAHWMIRDHAISVLPSVASLRTLRDRSLPVQPPRYLGVGDPVIGAPGRIDCQNTTAGALRSAPGRIAPLAVTQDGQGVRLADPARLRDLPRLPDTRCELEAIAGVFGGESTRLMTAASATETALKDMNATGELATYDVIVFATHGLVAGEAGAASPGLVLTPPASATERDDGLLSAPEIGLLDLAAGLVVLSACNTAAGEDQTSDGLSGLTRAFFHAGARSVLVTQWSVYSEAAVDVTTGLFAQAASDQDATAERLRQSLLRILDAPDAPPFKQHPSYWAAFTLVGAE